MAVDWNLWPTKLVGVDASDDDERYIQNVDEWLTAFSNNDVSQSQALVDQYSQWNKSHWRFRLMEHIGRAALANKNEDLPTLENWGLTEFDQTLGIVGNFRDPMRKAITDRNNRAVADRQNERRRVDSELEIKKKPKGLEVGTRRQPKVDPSRMRIPKTGLNAGQGPSVGAGLVV